MQPFQQRVVDEKFVLDEKIGALSLFLATTIYQTLPEDERMRLGRQHEAMSLYSSILGERIKAFV